MTDIGAHPEPRLQARQAPQAINGIRPISRQYDLDVSIVMPCLNEEASVGKCVETALTAVDRNGLTGEVVVVDNASTDASARLAREAGAAVVSEPVRGYGRAYLRGLDGVRGRVVVLGDSDGTYDFAALSKFVEPLTNGTDVVIGSRLRGTIDDGAMPWHHRYLGNPVLTKTMNALLSTEFSDVYCGMRSIRSEALSRLRLSATGMEFALEMLIAAERQGMRIEEVPIHYSRRMGGTPKLRTWRDGWRSLRFIVSASKGTDTSSVIASPVVSTSNLPSESSP